jgi:G5-linked-Ubiquitin-like domain
VRRSLQLSLFALVLVGLVGGSVAYYLAQKSLTLTVDGQSRSVSTYAGTVGEVLAEEGCGRPRTTSSCRPRTPGSPTATPSSSTARGPCS